MDDISLSSLDPFESLDQSLADLDDAAHDLALDLQTCRPKRGGSKPGRKYQFGKNTVMIDANTLPENEFRERYRMSKRLFNILVSEFGQYLPLGESSNGKSLHPPEPLLIFLMFLGGNATYYHQKAGFTKKQIKYSN